MRRIIFFFLDLFLLERSPTRLAGAVALGVLAGFSVPTTLQFYLFLLLLLSIRVHLPVALCTLVVVSSLADLFDPLTDRLGYLLLVRLTPIRPVWAMLYHAPIVPFTAFNHTVIMGSFVLSLVSAITLFFVLLFVLNLYGGSVWNRVRRSSLGYTLRQSPFYQTYTHARRSKT